MSICVNTCNVMLGVDNIIRLGKTWIQIPAPAMNESLFLKKVCLAMKMAPCHSEFLRGKYWVDNINIMNK